MKRGFGDAHDGRSNLQLLLDRRSTTCWKCDCGMFCVCFFLFERSSSKTHLRLLLLDLRGTRPGSVRVHLNGVLFADMRSRLTVIVNKEELLSGGGFFSFFF